MLMSDLKHDLVRTYVARLAAPDWARLEALLAELRAEGAALLAEERIPEARRAFHVKFDCRYLKQYHEVSFVVPEAALAARDVDAIASAFHAEHNRLYGYALAEQGVPVEIINVRLQALGTVDKPAFAAEPHAGADAAGALKGERPVYQFEDGAFRPVPVYDGHALRHGNRIAGPALVEEETTAVVISAGFDAVCDPLGSLVLYRKGRAELVAPLLDGGAP
jgi:N-methylhydantoinase A